MSNHADPLGAKAPEGPTYPYDRCRGKPAGFLCPEKGGGTPHLISDIGDAGGVADVAPAHQTIPGVNLQRVLHVGSCLLLLSIG